MTQIHNYEAVFSADLQSALEQACLKVGIVLPKKGLKVGWQRADLVGGGRGDGGIKLFPDALGGLAKNWQTGEIIPFFVDDKTTLSDGERMRRRQEALAHAQEEQAKQRKSAANQAKKLWHAASPAQTDHPYLLKKQVHPTTTLRELDATAATSILGYAPQRDGDLLVGRLLVVPIKIGSEVTSAELIDEAGRKVSIRGGAVSGGFWAAQPLPKAVRHIDRRRRGDRLKRTRGHRLLSRRGTVLFKSSPSRESISDSLSDRHAGVFG